MRLESIALLTTDPMKVSKGVYLEWPNTPTLGVPALDILYGDSRSLMGDLRHESRLECLEVHAVSHTPLIPWHFKIEVFFCIINYILNILQEIFAVHSRNINLINLESGFIFISLLLNDLRHGVLDHASLAFGQSDSFNYLFLRLLSLLIAVLD